MAVLPCMYIHIWTHDMATKLISVDLEAYQRLDSVQRANGSFSQTIKRVIRSPFDVDAWLRRIRRGGLSEEALDAVEDQVRRRRRRTSRRER